MKIFYHNAIKLGFGGASILLPLVVAGQTFTGTWFTQITTTLQNVVTALVPIFLTLGLLVFLWGLIKFLTAAGSEDAAASGKRIMIWGILAMFVMVAIWGIVAFLGQISGIDTNTGTQVGPGAPQPG
jgi:hypothetical protein